MTKKIIIALVVIALIIYTVVLISWWNEGTENFERQRIETCAEHRRDGTTFNKLPQGCR